MGRRILVVEDEATIADAVAARLRSEGYEVTWPATASRASTWRRSCTPTWCSST